jgi:hypothetical protein
VTKRKVWRYWCDHCKKGGLHGGHMANHEKGCTANPNRICRMHAHFPDTPQRPVAELRAAFNMRLPDFGMGTLRELAGDCPMCILAAIRQSGISKWDGDPESGPPSDLKFDFKKELAEAWGIINDAKKEDNRSYDYGHMY